MGAPTTAVVPSDESASEAPKKPSPISALAPLVGAASFAFSLHAVALLCVNTQAAPRCPSDWPAISAVVASSDIATASPKVGAPTPASAPVVGAVSLACSAHVVPVSPKTQAAPTLPLSASPPMIAVRPSGDRAVALPKSPAPISRSLPVVGAVNLCCSDHVPVVAERVNSQAAPTKM